MITELITLTRRNRLIWPVADTSVIYDVTQYLTNYCSPSNGLGRFEAPALSNTRPTTYTHCNKSFATPAKMVLPLYMCCIPITSQGFKQYYTSHNSEGKRRGRGERDEKGMHVWGRALKM